jgi:hypothetical protein
LVPDKVILDLAIFSPWNHTFVSGQFNGHRSAVWCDRSRSALSSFGISTRHQFHLVGRDTAYEMWLDAAIKGGLQGMIQYQVSV